jgi:hypothetical protein
MNSYNGHDLADTTNYENHFNHGNHRSHRILFSVFSLISVVKFLGLICFFDQGDLHTPVGFPAQKMGVVSNGAVLAESFDIDPFRGYPAVY